MRTLCIAFLLLWGGMLGAQTTIEPDTNLICSFYSRLAKAGSSRTLYRRDIYDENARLGERLHYKSGKPEFRENFFYDAAGLLVRRTESDPDGNVRGEWTYARKYDEEGRLLELHMDPGGVQYTVRYAEDGSRVETRFDSLGSRIDAHYDADGLLAYEEKHAVVKGQQRVSATHYDSKGNETRTTLGEGADQSEQQRKNVYDANGQLTYVMIPWGMGQDKILESFKYDDDFRCTQHTIFRLDTGAPWLINEYRYGYKREE